MCTPVTVQAEQFIAGISNEITVAIFAIVGVLLGGLLTFLTTWALDYKRAERERKQYLLDKRIACYSKALEYISFLMTFPRRCIGRSAAIDTVYQNACSKEAVLYRFYDEFAIYATKPVIEKFDSLRKSFTENDGTAIRSNAYEELLCVIQKEIGTN